VPGFALTNQLGELVTREDLGNHVWLANIIFSRCAGPCPRLSLRFQELNRTFADLGDLRFVSLTADPAYDTPAVLARYGERFEADPARWLFLTGPKAELYRLAIDGLKLAVVEKQPEEREDMNDLFIHSTVLALVDRHGRPRAFFEGLEPGTPARIEAAVRSLVAEK
jgi:cytochrome oxidase Cu insertion factor (SCO1/SenC/PrrC family)